MNPLERNDEPVIVPELLPKISVCELLGGVTTKHVENLVKRGSMPAPIYLDRHPRWRRSELKQWLDDGCPVLDQTLFDAWQKQQREKNRRRKQSASVS